MPERIQRLRTRGWRMPPDAIYVGRRTRWGNPYRVQAARSLEMIVGDEVVRRWDWRTGPDGEDRAHAVMLYRERLDQPEQTELRAAIARELRGHDLCCWCPPGPCHADVLLEIADA